MAYCITPQWSGSTCPQVKLTVTQSSSTDTTATLSWTLQYVAHGSAAHTSVAKSYSVVINGSTVKSGTYNINGITGTTTIASGTVSITKGTSAKTIPFSVSFAFNLSWSGVQAYTKSASGNISVAAKTSYTIKYNANGGSGAPSSQTKWHGTAITLSGSKPTRTGYTFKGWATSSGGSASYAAGASYSANASVTLYAVWQAYTYTVKYDANGGSGAPANQTKTYGVALTLSSTIPAKTNYAFKGWSTTSGGAVVYSAGGSYTANSAVTLYAVWELAYVKPKITNLTVTRCDSAGTAIDTGTYARIEFDWETTENFGKVEWTITWQAATSDGSTSNKTSSIGLSGTSGHFSDIIGGEPDYGIALSTDSSYIIKVTISDTGGSATAVTSLSGLMLAMDALPRNKGVSFGKPAELEGVADFGYRARFYGGIMNMTLEPDTDLNDVRTPNTYIGANISTYKYANCPLTSGTFTLTVESAGEEGQVKQVLTRCSKTEPERYQRFYYQGEWGIWKHDGSAVLYVNEDTQQNLNDYIYCGTYYFNTSHTPLNLPSGCVNGWLIVLRADSGAIKQIWLRYGSINANDFNTYVRTGNTNGANWSNWKRLSAEPDLLFSGSSNGVITLSETAANFAYLEIFYTDNNNKTGGYTKVYSPNGQGSVCLDIVEAASGENTYFRRTAYSINGTKITPIDASITSSSVPGYARISGTAVSTSAGTNYIKIIRVLGHRP